MRPAEDGLERDRRPRRRTGQHHAERECRQHHGRHEEARAGVGEPGQGQQERRRPQQAAARRRRARSPSGQREQERSEGAGEVVAERQFPGHLRGAARRRAIAGPRPVPARWRCGSTGLGNTRFISGAHGISGEHHGAHHPRGHHQGGAGGHDQDGLPAALRRHEEHCAGHHEDAGELDGVAESGEHAGGQQVAAVARAAGDRTAASMKKTPAASL